MSLLYIVGRSSPCMFRPTSMSIHQIVQAARIMWMTPTKRIQLHDARTLDSMSLTHMLPTLTLALIQCAQSDSHASQSSDHFFFLYVGKISDLIASLHASYTHAHNLPLVQIEPFKGPIAHGRSFQCVVWYNTKLLTR
jgi:hypothetical protein